MLEIEQKIRKQIALHFKKEEADIGLKDKFTEDLGGDSLDKVEILLRMEKEFEIEIDDFLVKDVNSLEEAIEIAKHYYMKN